MRDIHAHGLRIALPKGWSGRVFSRSGRAATMHVASFPLPLSDGEFGDRSTALMPPGASFVALTEYVPGAGLEPGRGLFAPNRFPHRLDPTSFAASCLAHPRPGQAGMQHFFTAAGRPFCLYVVIAARRTGRREQLAAIDHVLSTLHIYSRV